MNLFIYTFNFIVHCNEIVLYLSNYLQILQLRSFQKRLNLSSKFHAIVWLGYRSYKTRRFNLEALERIHWYLYN